MVFKKVFVRISWWSSKGKNRCFHCRGYRLKHWSGELKPCMCGEAKKKKIEN